MQNEAQQQTEIEQFLRRFTRELPVTLNEHELQAYGKMLAEKVREEELAEDKKKQVVADHTNRIKVIRNEIKRIAEARAKGEELRGVVCGERLHGNVIEIVRLDRMEVVDTRPAELKDLQTEIPGTGMPTMPEHFDEGPRGEGLGTLADQPLDEGGEMVESSSGDQVYVGDADDHDEETRVGDDEPSDVGFGPSPDADEEIFDGDVPEDDEAPNNVVHGDFGGVVGQGDGESEDDMIDRKLREREEADSPKTTSAKPNSKPTRERSKSKNDAKNGKGKKRK